MAIYTIRTIISIKWNKTTHHISQKGATWLYTNTSNMCNVQIKRALMTGPVTRWRQFQRMTSPSFKRRNQKKNEILVTYLCAWGSIKRRTNRTCVNHTYFTVEQEFSTSISSYGNRQRLNVSQNLLYIFKFLQRFCELRDDHT